MKSIIILFGTKSTGTSTQLNYEMTIKNMVPIFGKSINDPDTMKIGWTLSKTAKNKSKEAIELKKKQNLERVKKLRQRAKLLESKEDKEIDEFVNIPSVNEDETKQES